jgi:hypothetical protein
MCLILTCVYLIRTRSIYMYMHLFSTFTCRYMHQLGNTNKRLYMCWHVHCGTNTYEYMQIRIHAHTYVYVCFWSVFLFQIHKHMYLHQAVAAHSSSLARLRAIAARLPRCCCGKFFARAGRSCINSIRAVCVCPDVECDQTQREKRGT